MNDKFSFFKAIIIFDLLHATDGHGKNFSIFLGKAGLQLTPFYDVMSDYFLYQREKIPFQKLKLAMKVRKSGYYAFKRIRRKHYEETADLCGIKKEQFEEIISELSLKYQKINFSKKEISPHCDQKTLDLILEGMKERAKVIF